MDEKEMQAALLDLAGLRIGDHMARYVLKRLASGEAVPVAVLAQDARTGVPVCTSLAPAQFARLSPSLPA